MLNGDDNENGFKTNRSNQQKTNCTCSTLFLLISKKQICTCSTLFCLSLAVVLHDYNTKTSNFLVAHYFYGGIVVCAYPIFCFLCSCSLLFFTAAHFHLAGRQQFLIFSPPLSISMFFSLPKGDRYLLKTSRRAAGGIKVVDYPRNVKFSLSSYTFFVIGV